MPIKLVTFDALHTLLTPRRPIYVQYSQVFSPYLGVLSPESLKCSFKASQPPHPKYALCFLTLHSKVSRKSKKTNLCTGDMQVPRVGGPKSSNELPLEQVLIHKACLY